MAPLLARIPFFLKSTWHRINAPLDLPAPDPKCLSRMVHRLLCGLYTDSRQDPPIKWKPPVLPLV